MKSYFRIEILLRVCVSVWQCFFLFQLIIKDTSVIHDVRIVIKFGDGYHTRLRWLNSILSLSLFVRTSFLTVLSPPDFQRDPWYYILLIVLKVLTFLAFVKPMHRRPPSILFEERIRLLPILMPYRLYVRVVFLTYLLLLRQQLLSFLTQLVLRMDIR